MIHDTDVQFTVYYRRIVFFVSSPSKMPVSASGNTVTYCCLTGSVSFPLVDNIDISSTANLYKSLAQAAPEIKQCVDACNFIAESTRQQNNIGSVSVALNFICLANSLYLHLFQLCFECVCL